MNTIINYFLNYLLITLLIFYSTSNLYPKNIEREKKVSDYFEKIKANPNLLRYFFFKMPKGGDIHHHASGSPFAETYLEIAEKNELYVDMDSGRLFRNIDNSMNSYTTKILPVKDALKINGVRDRLIDQWSIRNFVPNRLSAHDHFFETFFKFNPAYLGNEALILAKVKNSAFEENVQYIETMVTTPKEVSAAEEILSHHKWDDSITVEENLERWYSALQKKSLHLLAKNASDYVDKFDRESEDVCKRERLNCNVRVRYQLYALRVMPKYKVFAQLAIAYSTVSINPKILGVNLVAAEDNPISMNDYKIHMEMFKYLSKKFPTVRRSLHAGELNIGLVRPEGLHHHISDAIRIAGAERIGHGIDIMSEKDSIELLRIMAKNKIAVEIPLTSNEFILGIKKIEHPILVYLDYNVPVILSTDDPGVFRTDLTQQFVTAAFRYEALKYPVFKRMIRNSIRYSFMSKEERTETLKELNKRIAEFEELIIKENNL